MWQSLPRFALPRTKANGTAFLLQRAGKCTITSMGSTSWEMTTNLALPSSTRVVTWLRPNLMWTGLAVLPAPPFSAAVLRRSFFSCLVSGVYFERSLKRVEVWFLSIVWENWLMAAGTLSLYMRIRFCLWMRTYFGHLTKRVKFLTGWMSPPIRKFLGDFLKRDALASSCLAFPTTTFFPFTAFFT